MNKVSTLDLAYLTRVSVEFFTYCSLVFNIFLSQMHANLHCLSLVCDFGLNAYARENTFFFCENYFKKMQYSKRTMPPYISSPLFRH